MRRGTEWITVLLLLAACVGCVTQRSDDPAPLLPDPVPPEADPDKVRANIREIGENHSPAVLKNHLDELIRAGRHAEPPLFEALKDANPRRRANAVYVLRYSSNPTIPAKLAPLLRDPVNEVALEAAGVMAEKGRKEGVPLLIKALRHENIHVRGNAIRILQSVTKMSFGFHADHPKDRREFSIKKWEAWWRERGPTFRLASAGR
jgi:hypothetical protein